MIQSSINQLNIYVELFWKSFDFVDFFWKIFDFVDLFSIFESPELIQSYQSLSLKVNRLHRLLYENELTQSSINSFGKGTESIQSILPKTNRFKSINSIELIGVQVCISAYLLHIGLSTWNDYGDAFLCRHYGDAGKQFPV